MLPKKELGVIVFLVIYSVMIRLYHLQAPVNDRHHFRQTDTYAIVSNFLKGNSDILHPKFYQTPNPDNTEGFYFGEFPIYEYFIYLLFRFTGENLVVVRLFTIGLTSISTVCIYVIGRKMFNKRVGLASALAFTFFPSSVFWGRAISPDVMALTFFTLSLAVLLAKDAKWAKILSAVFWAGAILIKPFYLAFGLVYLYYFFIEQNLEDKKLTQKRLRNLFSKIILFSLPALILYGAWRLWAGTFPPSTIDPDPLSILHDRQGWWTYWHTSDWITLLFTKHFFGELLTPLGGLLAVTGAVLVMVKHLHLSRFINIWLLANFIISYTFAWGSWQHDYYLLPWLPVLSLLAGFATVEIVKFFRRLWTENLDGFEYFWRVSALIVVVFFVYFLGIKKFFDYRTDFFEPQGYELYAEDFQYDYQKIAQLIFQGETVVSVQKAYSPYAVNMLRRTGNILAIPENKPCPSEIELFNQIDHLHKLKANYLMIHKIGDAGVACSRQTLNAAMANRFQLIYQGKEFDLYEIKSQLLVVKGTKDQVILTVQNMGIDNTLEVGGIPGSVNTIEVTPSWQKIGESQYQTVVSSGDWLSFKIYWKSPEIQVESNNWFVDKNGFVVKK